MFTTYSVCIFHLLKVQRSKFGTCSKSDVLFMALEMKIWQGLLPQQCRSLCWINLAHLMTDFHLEPKSTKRQFTTFLKPPIPSLCCLIIYKVVFGRYLVRIGQMVIVVIFLFGPETVTGYRLPVTHILLFTCFFEGLDFGFAASPCRTSNIRLFPRNFSTGKCVATHPTINKHQLNKTLRKSFKIVIVAIFNGQRRVRFGSKNTKNVRLRFFWFNLRLWWTIFKILLLNFWIFVIVFHWDRWMNK